MENLILKGLTEVQGMKFHDIEGGFGETRKLMLVKDIAEIHGQDFGEINRRINDNNKRFKNYIDIFDIKANGFEPLGQNLGFTKQSFNQSKNIYLLSERGYSKLLKILEDDFAWERYEKLVDGYFNMRAKIKACKVLTPTEQLELQLKVLKEQDEKINTIETKMNDLQDSMPLFNIECKELQALVRKIGIKILGGYKSVAYQNNSLRGRVYTDIQHQLKREFGINRYEAIKRSQICTARRIVEEYKTPLVLADEIKLANSQISINQLRVKNGLEPIQNGDCTFISTQ